MTKNQRSSIVRRILRAAAMTFTLYAVIRLTLVIGIPALYINDEWVEALANRCSQRPSLCLDVDVGRAKVGDWWYGYILRFVAQNGKSSELKAFVLADMPDKADNSKIGPWNFVGVQVVEEAQGSQN